MTELEPNFIVEVDSFTEKICNFIFLCSWVVHTQYLANFEYDMMQHICSHSVPWDCVFSCLKKKKSPFLVRVWLSP